MTETRSCFMCGRRGLKQGERVMASYLKDGIRRNVSLCQGCASCCSPSVVCDKLDLLTHNRISQLWP